MMQRLRRLAVPSVKATKMHADKPVFGMILVKLAPVIDTEALGECQVAQIV